MSHWLAGCIALALIAAGCGGGNDEAPSGTQELSARPIRIGASLPLTAEFSEPGKAAQRGYRVWASMVNEGGGLLGRPVEVIVRDDASDQNTVIADYNALISREEVDLLLGTFSSLLNYPASTVAERNRMLYVEPAGAAPGIFARGYKYLFFAQQATADQQGDLFADYILSLPESEQPETAAYPSLDDPFAFPVVERIRARFEPAGIETVYRETYPIDTQNFDAIVNAMKAAQPGIVIHGAQFADGLSFIRAMLKAGFQPEWMFQTNAPSFGDQFAEGIGRENTEGIFYATSWAADAATPGNDQFVAAYAEIFNGETPAEDAADAFAAAQVLQAAVEAVGAEGLENQILLADWLRENEVQTILGTLKWDETGAPEGEFLIGQWQNGSPEVVLPEAATTSKEIVELDWESR